MHRRLMFLGAPLFLVAAVLFFPIVGFGQQAAAQTQDQAEAPVLLRTLRRGSAGDDVRKLQSYLKQFPDVYPEGEVTGYFGRLTEAAVRRFQEQNGLPSVGIVGPMTRERLSQRSERAERVNVVTESLQRGRSGENVRRLQEFLTMFPDIYPERQVTGNFGPATESAIRRFQEMGGRPVSGEVDSGTQELINRLTVEGARQKPPKISSVSPASGPAGVTVTVTGKGFTPENNAIFVRGKTIVFGLRSDDGGTSITFVLPSNAPCTVNPPKACPIKVINQNGISNAKPFKLINLPEAPEPEPEPTPTPTPTPEPTPEPVAAAPVIDNLVPLKGPVGSKVTIEGSGFTPTGNSVNFGGVSNAVTSLTSFDGKTLSFTVPQTQCIIGTTCSVSVTNTNGTSSVVPFLLTQVITPIKIVVPNGGEQFLQGVQNAIGWTGGTDRVQILLVNASTTNNIDPTAEILGWIATSTTPDGSVTWDPRKVCNFENILCSEVAPGQYKILALSEDELGSLMLWDDIQNKTGNWDVSDNPFTVLERPTLLVTFPNWGGVYTAGQYLTVSWYSYNLTSKQVVINLLKDNQTVYTKTVTQGYESGYFGGGFYLPISLPPGSDYKIQAHDATNSSLHDESDVPFTIVNTSSYIEVKSPNGGEMWTAGFKGYVKWQSLNIASKTLNINLLKGGVFYRSLATNLPQGYTWSTYTYTGGTFDKAIDIPSDIPNGGDYTLEISDAANSSVRDVSDQPFTIVKLPDTITIRAKFLDYKTNQPLINQSVGVWDGMTSRQILTSSTGELLLTVNTADIIAKRYIYFYTSPGCYDYKYFYVFTDTYGLYGVKYSSFNLLGLSDWKQIRMSGDTNFGDIPFWQVTSARMISDTPARFTFYYRNNATGQSYYSGGTSSITTATYGRMLPAEVDTWAKLEDFSGLVTYSPYVNISWGTCTAKTITNFNRSIQWEPYQVTATVSYSPTYLKVGNAVLGNVTASGGVAPYTFTVASGFLPPGVALSSDGILSGTTTETGIYDAMIRVTDNQGANGAVTVHFEVRTSTGVLPPSIRAYSPSCGNAWYPGNTIYIYWYSYNIASKSVKIELLKAGIPYLTITTYTQPDPNGYYSYGWTIPKDFTSGLYSVRASDATDVSVTSQTNSFWVILPGPAATWNAWGGQTVRQDLSLPNVNLTNVATVKLYEKKPGTTSSSLIASCPNSTYYYSYCGAWYLYNWSGRPQLYRYYSAAEIANLSAGAYEYTVTTVDAYGVESAPLVTLKTYVMNKMTLASPTVNQSPIATPLRIEWPIPKDWPQGADRSFYVMVREKSNYYSQSWAAPAGPFPGLETTGYRTYDGSALDPTKTYQASIWSTPHVIDPYTGMLTSYLVTSNLSNFWVKP